MKHGKKKAECTAHGLLKTGDVVMVIAGGNSEKRPNKGKTGKILRFTAPDRAIVEGLNMVTKHQRATGPEKPAGKFTREAPIHVSNLMLYVEKLKKPVKIRQNILTDGRKVRGYKDPESKKFVQLDS
jgi:large subunit ribosomal protein L24